MPIVLLAETITINLGILVLFGALLTMASVIVGGAIAWGALRTTVTRLEATVTKLEGTVTKLTNDVAVLLDRSKRESGITATGRHLAAVQPITDDGE